MRLFLKNSYLRFSSGERRRIIISEGTVNVQGWRHLIELFESSCHRRYLEQRHHKPTDWMLFGDMQIRLPNGQPMNFNVLRVGAIYNPFTRKVTVNRVRFAKPVSELRRQYYMSLGINIFTQHTLTKPHEWKEEEEDVNPWDRPREPAMPPRDVGRTGLRLPMEHTPMNPFGREPGTVRPYEPTLYAPRAVVKMRRPRSPWYVG